MPKKVAKKKTLKVYVLSSPQRATPISVEAPSPKSAAKKIFRKISPSGKEIVITIKQIHAEEGKAPRVFKYKVMRRKLAKPRAIKSKTGKLLGTASYETVVLQVK